MYFISMLKPVTQIPIISTTGDHSRAFSNKFPSTSFEATIAISTKLYSPNNAIPHQDPRENGFPCFGACINQRRIIQTEYKSRLDQQARHDPPNLNPLSLSLSLFLSFRCSTFSSCYANHHQETNLPAFLIPRSFRERSTDNRSSFSIAKCRNSRRERERQRE